MLYIQLFTNRALCALSSSEPLLVLNDCSTVLHLEPENLKALYRRGLAHSELAAQQHTQESQLEMYLASRNDLEKVYVHDSTQQNIKQKLDEVIRYFKRDF
ncbi:MAG: hypothetical protein ACK56F_31240 [bacterium]